MPSQYPRRGFNVNSSGRKPTIIHGALTTLWMLLLLVQTSLIATNKRKLHATLGMLGIGLTLMMIPSSVFIILYKIEAGARTVGLGGTELTTLMVIYTILLIEIFFRKNKTCIKGL